MATPAGLAGRSRLDSIRSDFFLDDAHRLSEQERALMGGMLATLIDQLMDELLAALPPLTAARIEPARQRIAARMWNDGALSADGLIALLVRRSDEQRMLSVGQRPVDGGGAIDQMVADPDEGIAVAAMALTVARGRRKDRFGRIGIDFDDLAADEARELVYRLSAASRIEGAPDRPEVDAELARAAEDVLSRRVDGEGLEALTSDLASALHGAGRDGPAELDRLLSDGEAGLIAALLAARAGIEAETGWCLLAEAGPHEVMLLARMADLDRSAAARLLASLGEGLGISDPVSAIAHYDALSAPEIEEQQRWYRLPRPYRDALNWLDGNG